VGYHAGIGFKALEGAAEIGLGGVVLVSRGGWLRLQLYRATRWVLLGDPNSWLGHQLQGGANQMHGTAKLLAGAILVGQGFVKLLLVASLLRGARWAFHAAVVLLWLFVAAALWRFAVVHRFWLLAAAVLDALIAILVRAEYVRRGADGPEAQAKEQVRRK
jgi:uncharacterized membrane protein